MCKYNDAMASKLHSLLVEVTIEMSKSSMPRIYDHSIIANFVNTVSYLFFMEIRSNKNEY